MPPRIAVTPYERLAFLEMGVHDRSGRRAVARDDAEVEKWTRDVHVTIEGPATAADREQVQQTVAALAPLMAPRRVVFGGGRDVTVHFVPHADFATVLGSGDFPAYADGVTRPVVGSGANAGVLDRATVVVDSTIPQYGRNRVITHELLHAVGLNHSTCRSSVMVAQTSTGTSPRWSLSALDRRMLALLYRPDVAPGTPAARLARMLSPTATSGAECEPVTSQIVIDATTQRPYFCTTTAARYQPCTADVNRELVAPIAHPDLWFDGTYVFTRDPG